MTDVKFATNKSYFTSHVDSDTYDIYVAEMSFELRYDRVFNGSMWLVRGVTLNTIYVDTLEEADLLAAEKNNDVNFRTLRAEARAEADVRATKLNEFYAENA